MARNIVWRVFLGLTAAAALVGCVETSGAPGTEATSAAGTGSKVRAGEEVEAPDVFQSSESALWDGRPSLGGIWVASPDVVDPERVIMFNPATGLSVKGALFRRERENPGPRLQLSSDAAEALGVLAGMPTEIQVTALRKTEVVEEVAEPSEVAPEEGVTAAEATEAGPADPAATDAASVAAAALDAVDGAATVEGGTPADPAAVAAEGEVAPKAKTNKEKRAEAKAAREAKKAAAAAAKAAAAAGAEPIEGEALVTPDAVTGSEIEAMPLDAGTPDVAEDSVAVTEPVAVEEVVASDPVPSGSAARPIQIASFSKEDNANRAIEALSKIGIEAQSKKIEKDGKVYWSVVASGDDALLAKIKDAGFADAYFLK